MRKAPTLLADLKARQRTRKLSFVDALPPERQAEFAAIAQAIATGEISIGITAVSRRLIEAWELPVCLTSVRQRLAEKVQACRV
jgi:hypothetical protein